ncbi:esterase-like [Dendrobium catenatum]|uniref:esterase-like n=1 Tax=Dendrobium catenatum TaxID=906689 RepID=UPI0010A0B5E8|nr:esterase-like [Dendrobium catenatum]
MRRSHASGQWVSRAVQRGAGQLKIFNNLSYSCSSSIDLRLLTLTAIGGRRNGKLAQITIEIRFNSGIPISFHYESLMPKKEYFNQSLYTIDIRQNDITAGLDAGKTYDELIPQTLSTFSGDVKSMYALGVRYFWIHNTGPLGCLAYVLLRRNIIAAGELDSAGCAVFYNKAAQQFNKKLNETLVEMRKELPLAVITYVDIYFAKYSLFLEPAKYGTISSSR